MALWWVAAVFVNQAIKIIIQAIAALFICASITVIIDSISGSLSGSLALDNQQNEIN